MWRETCQMKSALSDSILASFSLELQALQVGEKVVSEENI
jgi:hypothetical protein